MILTCFLVRFAASGLDGVEFSKDNKVLISTPSNLPSYTVPKECEIINGGDSVLKSSFLQCINTIQTIDFEENSQLKCIYPFVFQGSSLIKADLRNCNFLLELNFSLFRESSKLETVLLPEGLLTLCSGCLYGAVSLKSLTIPDSVETIQGYANDHRHAFYKCSNLAELIISPNSNLKVFGSDCFDGTKISSLYIPKNITYITNALFGARITNITIHPDNHCFAFDGKVLSSYDNTTVLFFIYNEGIKYTVPSYVKEIGTGAFRTNKITEITFQSSMKSIGSLGFAATKIEHFEFPEGITVINDRTLSGCPNLQSVTLTSNITTIEKGAFQGCIRLTTINLHDDIKTIGNNAF